MMSIHSLQLTGRAYVTARVSAIAARPATELCRSANYFSGQRSQSAADRQSWPDDRVATLVVVTQRVPSNDANPPRRIVRRSYGFKEWRAFFMSEQLISAEIEPQPSQSTCAAQALQRLGFRVLHIGRTISVQGPQQLWESTFPVSFAEHRKTDASEIEHEVSFPRPQADTIPVPVTLQALIASVAFVEPPEWFGGPS